jgi:hypothetical protein
VRYAVLCYVMFILTHNYYFFITSQHILLLLPPLITSPAPSSPPPPLIPHHSYQPLTTTTPTPSFPFHLSYSFLTTHCRDADGTFQMTGVAELDNVCEALGLELSEEEMEVSAIVIRCCDKVVGMMWCFSCFYSCLLSMS